jgi:hypothetical protein
MAGTVGGDNGWSLWEAIVTLASGGGIFAAIGAILHVGTRYGSLNETIKGLRSAIDASKKELDDHCAVDDKMFGEVHNHIDSLRKDSGDLRVEIAGIPKREEVQAMFDRLEHRLRPTPGPRDHEKF